MVYISVMGPALDILVSRGQTAFYVLFAEKPPQIKWVENVLVLPCETIILSHQNQSGGISFGKISAAKNGPNCKIGPQRDQMILLKLDQCLW